MSHALRRSAREIEDNVSRLRRIAGSLTEDPHHAVVTLQRLAADLESERDAIEREVRRLPR